jgi:O-antigen/teichoic acid export membrane protein
MSPQSPAGSPELRANVVRGLAWSITSLLTSHVSRLIFGIILARLLTPREYGLAAMALVFSSLVLVVSDLGLGAALVQRPTITEPDRSTVFWTSVFIGLGLTALGFLLSGAVASLFGEPSVQPMFAVLSVTFLIMALGRAQAALFQREMNFRAISIRGITATLVGGSVGVAAAAMGFGAWSLIAQHITIAAASTVLLWTFSPWWPQLTFSRKSLRDLGGFSLNVSGARIVEYLNASSDKLLIGKFLGSSALGIYSIAYNIVLIPLTGLLVAVRDTLFPALSRIQDDRNRLAAGWLRSTRLLAAISMPAMLSLVVVAPDFVVVVLGEQWEQAVPILQILALAGIVQSISAVAGTVLTAVDRTHVLLRFSLVEVAFVVIGIGVGLRWGIIGVAAAYTIVTAATRLFLSWLSARAVQRTFSELLAMLVDVAQASFLTAAGVAIARYALIRADVPPSLRLIALVLLGLAFYVALAAWRMRDVLTEVASVRRRRNGEVSPQPRQA